MTTESSSNKEPSDTDPIRKNNEDAVLQKEAIADIGLIPTLLQRPDALLDKLALDHQVMPTARALLLYSIGSLAMFGAALGFFSLGAQLWAAPLKLVLGLGLTAALCLPSLYVFSCLSGITVPIRRIVGVLAAFTCLTSILLAGFAPISLIFSQSSESIKFVGALNLLFWCIALSFGSRLLRATLKRWGSANSGFHLHVWLVMFALVSFQMTTSLRPILGNSDQLFTMKKKFFLSHWFDTSYPKEGRHHGNPRD